MSLYKSFHDQDMQVCIKKDEIYASAYQCSEAMEIEQMKDKKGGFAPKKK